MNDTAKEILKRVRELREIEEISAEAFARELGFDPAEYKDWESGAKDFPMGSLAEVAVRLKVDLAELVSGSAAKLKTYCITRAGGAPEVSRRPNFAYWNLAYNFHGKRGDPFYVEAEAVPADSPVSVNTHPGQEFDYVLEGRLLVTVGGHETELGPGDSIFYDSNEPHGMKALDGKQARFLAFLV